MPPPSKRKPTMTDSTPENEPGRNDLAVPPEQSAGQALPSAPAASGGKPPATKPRRKRQARQAVDAAHICATQPTNADIVYMAREFILCTLPHSDPGPVLSWSRSNGNLTLGIVSGVNVKTGKPYGIPYGIIPRLLLVWIVTEITRTKSRRLELGNTLADFLARLGLNPSNGTGKRSDARRLREQMERLFRASIHFLEFMDGGGRSGLAWDDGMKIAPKGVLWWSEKDPGQGVFWGSWIEVSEAFYKATVKSPNPLDVRVLHHIKDSSLGIDLYTILNREAFLAMQDGKPRFLAWEWLHEQTGNEYKRLCDFRRDALVQVKAVLAAHPGLIMTQQRGQTGQKSGLVISNLSTPSVPPASAKAPVQHDPGRAPPALALVPPPPAPAPLPERCLKPATVARFRAMYPNLDPYACKAAFDAWAEGLPPERRPHHYDAAFRGFAEKWVVGKLIVNTP